MDDSGARYQGNNGDVTQIGYDWFAWFVSTESKSRSNFLQSLHAGNLTDTPNEHALSDFQDELLPNDLVGRRRRGRKKGEIKTSPSGLCRYGMHSAAPVPLANGGSRKEANPRPPGQATSSTPPALILYQCWGKNEREDRTRRYALQKQIPRVVNTTA